MNPLKRQVKEAMARVGEVGRDAQRFGGRVAERSSVHLESAGKALSSGYRKTRRQTKRIGRSLATSVQDRPGRTLALAFGAGVIIGILVGRRRER